MGGREVEASDTLVDLVHGRKAVWQRGCSVTLRHCATLPLHLLPLALLLPLPLVGVGVVVAPLHLLAKRPQAEPRAAIACILREVQLGFAQRPHAQRFRRCGALLLLLPALRLRLAVAKEALCLELATRILTDAIHHVAVPLLAVSLLQQPIDGHDLRSKGLLCLGAHGKRVRPMMPTRRRWRCAS